MTTLYMSRYNHKTGEWAHSTRLTRFPERQWLSRFDLFGQVAGERMDVASSTLKVDLEGMFRSAERELQVMEGHLVKRKKARTSRPRDIDEDDRLRWFILLEDTTGDVCEGGGSIRPTANLAAIPAVELVLDVNDINFDAYGKKRDSKLRTRRGGEELRTHPRYLQLMNVDLSTSPPTQQQQRSEELDHHDGDLPVHNPESSMIICTNNSCFTQRSTEQPPQVSPAPQIKEKIVIPKKILRQVGQAIQEWSMIKEGDRLLLGLSGGKDSMCLLHVLMYLQKKAPIKFEIACATVDPQTESYNPSPLIPYLKALEIKYFYLSEPIVEMAKTRLQVSGTLHISSPSPHFQL